jgi:hypothetical protein
MKFAGAKIYQNLTGPASFAPSAWLRLSGNGSFRNGEE